MGGMQIGAGRAELGGWHADRSSGGPRRGTDRSWGPGLSLARGYELAAGQDGWHDGSELGARRPDGRRAGGLWEGWVARRSELGPGTGWVARLSGRDTKSARAQHRERWGPTQRSAGRVPGPFRPVLYW